MKVLAHRGCWRSPSEKNGETALRRAFELGFGIETDVRDCAGALVISHDPPAGGEPTLHRLLALALACGAPPTLALNVKADGLAGPVARALREVPGLDCFVFDMSVPDMRGWFSAGVPTWTRLSEVEREPVWLERAQGVWLDAFEGEWYDVERVARLLDAGKRVCVVSPELHGRAHDAAWRTLAPLAHRSGLAICTDLPEQAAAYFGGGETTR